MLVSYHLGAIFTKTLVQGSACTFMDQWSNELKNINFHFAMISSFKLLTATEPHKLGPRSVRGYWPETTYMKFTRTRDQPLNVSCMHL